MSKKDTASKVTILDLGEEEGVRHVAIVATDEGNLQHNWKTLLSNAVTVTGTKKCYWVNSSRLGRGLTVKSDGGEQFLKDIAKVAKKLPAPPELTFEVVHNENPDGSTDHIVYYDGEVSTRLSAFPKAPVGTSIACHPDLKKVIITAANPLFSVSEEFIEQVKAALQATSISTSDQ